MSVPTSKRIIVAVSVAAAVSFTGLASVHAQPPGSDDADLIRTAQAAAAAQAAVFGFGPDQTLTAKDVFSDQVGAAVRFDRQYRGVPVVGGDFIVHLTPDGAFRYGNGTAVASMPASVTPTVADSAAIATATAAQPYAVASSTATLVVFASDTAAPLAWQVRTASADSQHADITVVDATTGAVLASWSAIQNDDGIGRTLYSGKVELQTTKEDNHWVLEDKTRGDQKIYDAHSQDIGSGTLFQDRDNSWGKYTVERNKTAAADAAYSLAETWDYYLDTYDRKGIGDDGVAARGFVHVYQNWVNASWDDSCFCMRFGDGNVAGGTTPLVALDVGGHEMSHGVTSRTAGLVYANESGGLNESTSDVMGTEVEFFSNNEFDVADYVIGEEIFTQYDPANNYIRRMDKPSMDGLSADCWYSGVGNLNVHYSSGVGNHLFYLLSEGSGKKTINGIDYDSPTCNGKSVTGIGHEKAAAVWYKALTEQWTSTTNYHDARDGMLKAAADLYGASSDEYKAVDAAWAAVDVTE